MGAVGDQGVVDEDVDRQIFGWVECSRRKVVLA